MRTSNNNPGTLKVIRKNSQQSIWNDAYHNLLILSWTKTILLFMAIFILLNLFFAFLYWIVPDSLHNSTGRFVEAFYFSVQTLGTIGYGLLAPKNDWANFMVALEAAIGIMGLALLSGLFYSKFSLPRAQIRFTKNILMTTYQGKKILSFRIANTRCNQVIDSRIHFSLLKTETTSEGQVMRRFLDLFLERSHVPIFSMTMTVMHPLESGPLKDMSIEEICARGDEFFVTLVGTDSTIGQTIHATYLYQAKDMVKDKIWSDIVKVEPGGTRIIDFKDFDHYQGFT